MRPVNISLHDYVWFVVAVVCGMMVFCSLFAAQHFQSSNMTLSERFALYQRKAAEVEMRKPRKSPEIHRYLKHFISDQKSFNHLFHCSVSS